MLIAVLFTIAKIWKEAHQVPINRQVDKKNVFIYIYTHTHICWAIKKNEILPFVTAWMDLEGIMLSEINKSVRKRQIPYDFT